MKIDQLPEYFKTVALQSEKLAVLKCSGNQLKVLIQRHLLQTKNIATGYVHFI